MTSVTALDPRGQLLRSSSRVRHVPDALYDRALHTLLDSWTGIGHIAVGMHRQGYGPQLTQYDDRDWHAQLGANY